MKRSGKIIPMAGIGIFAFRFLLAAAPPAQPPRPASAVAYAARQATIDAVAVVLLSDAAHQTEVTIVPSVGNQAFEMKVKGINILWGPAKSLREFQEKPGFAGIPFMAPWANRLDQDAFYANGKKYLLNPQLGNFRRDPNQRPIHGLLGISSAWKVVSVKADQKKAEVTSRLEFWRHPDLMAQFPFAHTLEMTYRLQGGELEVETALFNHAVAPMPVAVGYHPYFQVQDAPRDQWKVHVAAKEQLVISDLLIPTGESKPSLLADPVSLAETTLDDVFSGLVRDEKGRAHFWFQGVQQRVTVTFGPKYQIGIVYAPPRRDFICIEPMAAITNAFNLAQSGVYKQLQSVPPDGVWRESFWVRPSGF